MRKSDHKIRPTERDPKPRAVRLEGFLYSEYFAGWLKAFSANMEPGPSKGWVEGYLKQVYGC